MAFRPVALTGYTTTHFVAPGVGIVDPLSGSPTTKTPEGFGLAIVGLTQITGHPFGNQFHAPNPIISPGSVVVKVDGLPVAFIGDVFA